MQKIYKLTIGDINVKKPQTSLRIQIFILKFVGLWSINSDKKSIRILYCMWSFCYRFIFLYAYTLAQVLFFKDVENLKDVADASFLLVTQITLLYKTEKFYLNMKRMQKIETILGSSMFSPDDSDEDKFIESAMYNSVLFISTYLGLCFLTILYWSVLPFFENKLRFPISAWYPFNTDNPYIFCMIYIFQVYGIWMSALYNVAMDTLTASLIGHANAQIKRLGIILTKIGHKVPSSFNNNNQQIASVDAQMYEINLMVNKLAIKYNSNYGRIIKCIIFHDNILSFISELEDIFKSYVFAQLMSSVIIICMTCFLMVNQVDNIVQFAGSISYLITMLCQILVYCWVGNELIYSSNQLTRCVYLSNFVEFEPNTSRAMLILMQRTFKEIDVKVGELFQVTLSLPTFMRVIKSSYSYFALLRTIQNQ